MELCDDELGIEQREVIYPSLSVRNIEQTIADEVMNLWNVEFAVKEVVKSLRGIDVTGVVNAH